MSYNSNTHYTPRYGKNHSKKIYDSGTGGREGVTLQGNQSSSTYIGSGEKIVKQVQVPYHTPQADVTLMVGLAIDLVMSHTL